MEGFNGPHNLGPLSRIGARTVPMQSPQTNLQGVIQNSEWAAGAPADVKPDSLFPRLPASLWENQARPTLGTGYSEQPLPGLPRPFPATDFLSHGSLPAPGPGNAISGTYQCNAMLPENVATMLDGWSPECLKGFSLFLGL